MLTFNKLKIGNKLAIIMVGLSLVVIALLSSLFYVQFDRALKERVLLQLSSVKNLKILKIENELEDRLKEFKMLVSNETLLDGINKNHAFQKIEELAVLVDSLDIAWHNKQQPFLIDFTGREGYPSITVGFLVLEEGKYVLGVTEMPEVQDILLERTGLGQTGESYIVGEDLLLKSQSRFYEGTPTDILVDTEGVKLAMTGDAGNGSIKDYRGVEVFSSYEMISKYGLQWVVLTEIDHQEALFPLHQLRIDLLYMLLLIFVFVLVASYLLSRMFVSPVVYMEKRLNMMSRGIVEGVATDEKGYDEIGRMFDALNRLVTALSATIVFADKIGTGNFDAEYKPLSTEDKLGEALIRMRDRLTEYQQNEERLIKENQKSIINGEEKERSRISKEMHDGVGPLLTTLRMKIQSTDLDPDIERTLLKRLDDTIMEVRRISNNLMPSVLVDFGAGEAIANFINQVKENAEIKILYKNDLTSKSNVDDSIHIFLYRIAQESINNALKHAGATEIRVSVTSFDDHISYYISDNGSGFDVRENHAGNGLRNMRERVKVANGTIDITSDTSGTTIEVEIPIL